MVDLGSSGPRGDVFGVGIERIRMRWNDERTMMMMMGSCDDDG